MKVCYIDAFSGISGDMTVGALLDAGAPADALLDALTSLDTGARYEVEKTRRGGMTGTKFRVILPELPAGAHAHSHRHLKTILAMIEKAPISHRAKSNASKVFHRLGDAEAHVHGVPVEKVHFHEVGAADSIADIVGACVAFDLLDVENIFTSAINVGSGTVKTEHGILPVPAPATAELLIGKPIYSRGPAVELTTPTGAALATALSTGFGAAPAMSIQSIGYGAGDHDFKEQPNVLRVLIGETTDAEEATLVSVLEANIDDSSPQVLGYTLERLMGLGALDVSLSPLLMKKDRPGSLLRVIARPKDQDKLLRAIFEETSTIGIRYHTAERRAEQRGITIVDTEFGRIKVKFTDDGFAPEYEDCRTIAEQTGTPLRKVIAAANQAYLKLNR